MQHAPDVLFPGLPPEFLARSRATSMSFLLKPGSTRTKPCTTELVLSTEDDPAVVFDALARAHANPEELNRHVRCCRHTDEMLYEPLNSGAHIGAYSARCKGTTRSDVCYTHLNYLDAAHIFA